MKAFLDTNVILDVVLNRVDFVENSAKVLQSALDGYCSLYASDVTFTTISYYARKHRTLEQLYDVMKELRSIIEVAPTGSAAVDWAIASRSKDFEDSVQYYVALNIGADYIITRNSRDFPNGNVPICTPQEFLDIITCDRMIK